MRQILMLLAFLATFPICSNATVILLHGSFSTHSRWYRPGGAFYEQLNAQVTNRNEVIKPFAWSGGITQRAIIDAAGELVTHLLTLDHTDSLTLIAHSNGGNVSCYATMILAELRKELIATKSPINHETCSSLAPPSLYKPFQETYITKMQETKQVIPSDLEQQITNLYASLKEKFIHEAPAALLDKSFAIQELYLLGTPIDTTKFCIDMAIVAHVYNLYSHGDFVQTLVGKQELPFHERNTNLRVTIHEHYECQDCLDEAEDLTEPIAPCHECIHHPTVGRWLIHLPELIKTHSNYDNTAVLMDGELLLHSAVAPQYQPLDQELLAAAPSQNDPA